MKTITTAFAVLLATIFMTACEKKESAAPAEAAPAATAAPAEAAPAPTSEVPANTEDSPATGGDKVAPKSNDAPPPPSN
jgi:predicted small lipoprotein YifL